MILKFISWNIQKKQLSKQIEDLIKHDLPDILFLIESDRIDPATILNNCNGYSLTKNYNFINFGNSYRAGIKQSIKMTLFYRNDLAVNKIMDGIDYRYAYISLVTSAKNLLLIPSHLPSKPTQARDLNKAGEFYSQLVDELIEFERLNPKFETVIFGDLNLNPYEQEMLFSDSFFSERCPQTSTILTKIKKNTKLRFFNPSWKLLTNYAENAFGTFIYTGSDVEQWNVYDQVILRPTLINSFDMDSLSVITKSKNYSFLSGNRTINYSDHLPITFAMNI